MDFDPILEIKNLDDKLSFKTYDDFWSFLINLIKKCNITIFKEEEFEIGDKLGKGKFGTVYKACKENSLFAIKRLENIEVNFNKPDLVECSPKTFIKMIMSELISISTIKHDNIVRLHGVIISEEKNKEISLIFNFISGMNLSEYMQMNKGTISKSEILDYLIQLAELLTFIHSKNIIHRDIKPENLMITNEKKLILVDFGISKINHNVLSMTNSSKGTINYSPPENFEDLGDDSSKFTLSVKYDVWSVGCVIIELFSGQVPWSYKFADTNRIINAFIKKVNFPYPKQFEQNNPEIFMLCQEMLINEPEKRISSQELYNRLLSLKTIDKFKN